MAVFFDPHVGLQGCSTSIREAIELATFREFLGPNSDRQRVKSGFCWPAFFFTVFYLAAKRIWRWFGIWCVVWILGALLFALRYQESMREYYSVLNPLVLIANWTFHLVPGFMANKWRVRQLERDGYVEAVPNASGLETGQLVDGQNWKTTRRTDAGGYHAVVLVVAAIVVAAMILFPPYMVTYNGAVVDSGYAPIFDLPVFRDRLPAQVNAATLGAQVFGTLVVAGLLYFVKKRDR